LILNIVGYLDDKYHLSAKWQLVSMVAYITIALLGANLVISQLSYPFNQLIPDLYWLKFILSFAWVFLCVNATKILDGLDGLVGLVGFVGCILVVAVSFIPLVGQSLPAVMALIWAAAILGFLPYNFPNAKLYLGEGGSEMVGFLLAIFSLWSGAKVATVSMGIGLFILDILLVVLLRLRQRRSPLSGDRLHWHHRLIDLGLSKIQVLAITAIFLVGFGTIGLILPTVYKIWLILIEVLVLLGLLLWSNYARRD
jgi:UDP-GlcNAc:undecaprenyl-phosphate GlcNAc-1-phosphate transferase